MRKPHVTEIQAAVAAALAVLVVTSAARRAVAAPYFEEVPDPFGVQACAGAKEGCWTNYMRMTDIDGDGDLDLLFPNADGFFKKGAAEPFSVYLNDGKGSFSSGSAQIVHDYTGYVRQIATGDVDGDGDLDLYIPSAWGDADVLLFNDDGVFVDHAATSLPDLHSHAGAARFGDVDNDGDLDLFVSDGWAQSSPVPAHLYLNDGAGKFTEAAAGQLPGGKGAQPIDLDLFDADGDHDLDLLIDLHASKSLLWINDGEGNFTDASAMSPPQSGLKYGPVACDVDGDGDLDIWADNAGTGQVEQLLINDGTGHFTDETAARVTGNPGVDDNGVACVDVDGDGDLDAAIASLSGNERVLLNDGTGHFTAVAGAFPPVSDSTLWFEFGDVNGDGRLDCATAQGESSFLDRLYVGTPLAPVDTRAPTFRSVESVSGKVAASAAPIVRFAVVDNATTDEGPRLRKAWIRVTVGGAATDVPARFSGGDIYRAALPAQAAGEVTVSYEACAKDWQGNEGCAPAKTYAVEAAGTTSSASASGSSGEGGGGGGSGSDDGAGCGCSVPRRAPAVSGLAALGLAALALARRRRR